MQGKELSLHGVRGGVQRPQPGLSLLESQEIQDDSMECLGGKEGACTLPACRPAWDPWAVQSPAAPAQVQAQAAPSPLHFLGFPADLVIVVDADDDKEEAAGQEQHSPQGHEARLSKRGSDHCEGSRGSQRSGADMCSSLFHRDTVLNTLHHPCGGGVGVEELADLQNLTTSLGQSTVFLVCCPQVASA